MTRRPYTHAPVYVTCLCGKAYSPTKAAARQLRREIEDYKGKRDDCRYYTCEAGGVHWTRQVERFGVPA